MIEAVLQVIRDEATWGAWSERVEGLATRVGVKDASGKTVYFPFAHDVAECTYDARIHPASDLKSVVWWESGGSVSGDFKGTYKAKATLYGLLNFAKMGMLEGKSNLPQRKNAALICSSIINELTSFKLKTGDVKVLKVDFLGERVKDVSMFSKYSFPNEGMWYFGNRDFFALDFEIHFSVDCNVFVKPSDCE